MTFRDGYMERNRLIALLEHRRTCERKGLANSKIGQHLGIAFGVTASQVRLCVLESVKKAHMLVGASIDSS